MLKPNLVHIPKSADSLICPYMLIGHASGCWLSELGAGMPYNREEEKNSKIEENTEKQEK